MSASGSAPATVKYKHSKPANNYKAAERKKSFRKASNHKSVENIYGAKYPRMGGSLGVAYIQATGEISKAHRADSVA
jgi:uncharacterized protein with ACT and thioredoxin-like domain